MLRPKKVSWIFFLFISCAVIGTPLRLQDRTLLIDPKGPNLVYPHTIEECKYPHRKLFRLCRDKRVLVQYDLTNKVQRDILISAGFECVSKARFKY